MCKRNAGVWLAVGAAVLLMAGCGNGRDQRSRPPGIVQVFPDGGSRAGGEQVVIISSNFEDDFTIDVPEVFFGTVPATSIQAVNEEMLWVWTPYSPVLGPVDLEVRSSGMIETATLADGFTYTRGGQPGTVEFFGRTIPHPAGGVIYVLSHENVRGVNFGNYVDRFGDTVPGTRWDVVADRTIASIEALPEDALFNVYTYGCRPAKWSPEPVLAAPSNKLSAAGWILTGPNLDDEGMGPAVASALQDAQEITVLLASTGEIRRGTCGLDWPSDHLDMIVNANTQGAAVHTFGIDATGDDRQFLEDIAAQTGGTYTHVVP